MPAKQKQQQPRKPARRRRARRSETAGPSMALPGQTRDVHRFVRSVQIGALTPAAADKGWAWTFALSDLPNYTEFTALFDQYRLSLVELVFTWSPGTTVATSTFPTLLIASDYDSAAVPASSSEIAQRRHITWVFSPSKPIATFRLRPRVLLDVGSGGSSGFSTLAPAREWIDLAFSTLTQRGAVAWIANFNTGLGGTLLLEERFHFEVAGLR